MHSHSYIITKVVESIGIIVLNRPKYLNALSPGLIAELNQALVKFDKDPKIGCVIITGGQKIFAAGADIGAMKETDFPQNFEKELLGEWPIITTIKTPTIAVVNGYALGGGCELAMMCDIIYAGEKAKFGQPEIKLGVIPGAGGTQRLIRAIGKSKAMEMILGGAWNLTAQQAEQAGLVSKVFPEDKVFDEAIKLAKLISANPRTAVKIAKEAVNQSFEMPLNSGVQFERRLFHACFSTDDQKEGMTAFLEKRPAKFNSKL